MVDEEIERALPLILSEPLRFNDVLKILDKTFREWKTLEEIVEIDFNNINGDHFEFLYVVEGIKENVEFTEFSGFYV
jgi:hypothetical protein